MNTNSTMLEVGTVEVLVLYKPIKNLHLSVMPPVGAVRVSAPLHMREDIIRTLIATRLSWIKKQQSKFKGQERQTIREYVSGESHYFLGKRYRLEVIEENKTPKVELSGSSKMILYIRPNSSITKREKAIQDWYRKNLRSIIADLLPRWQNKIGVQVNDCGIKRMKTRWGTCNQKAKRVWLNLELAKKPIECIEYVLVHELLHLIEKKHNDRFTSLMSDHLPKWRSLKDELNRFMLSYEKWERAH